MTEIKIKYYVADGYVGSDRPKYAKAHADDFEDCEDDDEIRDRLEEIVNDHFRQNVFPEIADEEDDLIETVKKLRTPS